MKRLYALILSFSVYLLPLVGPHVIVLLGPGILGDIMRGDHGGMWIATDVGFAILLQSTAFAAITPYLKSRPGLASRS
jgi:hypothetical protein